jgi:hypothetical protein
MSTSKLKREARGVGNVLKFALSRFFSNAIIAFIGVSILVILLIWALQPHSLFYAQ